MVIINFIIQLIKQQVFGISSFKQQLNMTEPNNNQINIDGWVIHISFGDIIEKFGDAKRLLREDVEILNAGCVSALRIAPPPAKDRITGLVLQTSAMTNIQYKKSIHTTVWKYFFV